MVYVKPKDEPLTDFDKKIIGTLWCVLEVPLEDPILLKKVGEILSGLGRDISMNAGRDISKREKALIVKHRVAEANRRIKDLATENGISVPRAGKRRRKIVEQMQNETETATVTRLEAPLQQVGRKRC